MEKQEFRAWIFFIMLSVAAFKAIVTAVKFHKQNVQKYDKNKN